MNWSAQDTVILQRPEPRTPVALIFTVIVALSVGGAAFDRAHAGDKIEPLPLETFWGEPPEPPFEFALVLAGGGYDVFAHFGIVDAAIDLGMRPDVLIAPCGTSIVAAVLNAFPDREARLGMIYSPEFHRVMRAPERQKLTPAMASMVFSIWRRSMGLTDKLPRLYDFPVVEFADDFRADAIDSEFDSDGMRLIIVATRTEIGPEDKGQKREGRKLFQEVFFTDEDTAGYLTGFEAPVGHYFPDGSYMTATDVRLGASLFQAVRASISDMYFVEPYLYDGERYTTGGFDLHVEVAQGMARRIAVTMIKGYDPLMSDAAVKSVLGYRLNQRLKISTGLEVDWWVDITDKDDWGPMKFKILKGVPEDFDEFVELAHQQYAMGYCRGREGLLQQQSNEQRHIRKLSDRNAYKALRSEVKASRRRHGDMRDPICDPKLTTEAERADWLLETQTTRSTPSSTAAVKGSPGSSEAIGPD